MGRDQTPFWLRVHLSNRKYFSVRVIYEDGTLNNRMIRSTMERLLRELLGKILFVTRITVSGRMKCKPASDLRRIWLSIFKRGELIRIKCHEQGCCNVLVHLKASMQPCCSLTHSPRRVFQNDCVLPNRPSSKINRSELSVNSEGSMAGVPKIDHLTSLVSGQSKICLFLRSRLGNC